MTFFSRLIFLLFLSMHHCAFAQKIVNVYVWGGEIPKQVVQQFKQETGINVNFSTYDNNETMYARLKASRKGVYDVILPSSYYVERMAKQNLLTKLDSKKIPNIKNLDSLFTKNTYDPENQYSIPLTWGVTGIFYNKNFIKKSPLSWQNLWQKEFKGQLLLLDDPREIFSIALMSLGFEPNDTDPQHIEKAYKELLTLIPNIKLFASDNIQSIMIDEDALAGITWNGDAFKAFKENKAIQFVYPREGFILWVDCLAIPTNAPHLNEAYQFINFMLRPEIAKTIALQSGYAITNAEGKKLLPKDLQNNPMVYPDNNIIKRAYFQRDVSNETIALYNQYWEKLKLIM